MDDKRTLLELRRLYGILEAGEKGYAISAANVSNRGLKLLFKSFAQQRARFKAEILAEIQRLGGESGGGYNLLGAIHRGRINIFAALTIGRDEREQTVLKEILVGERFALRTYINTLEKELPAALLALISRQLAGIRQVIEQVALMRGKEGKRLVVRLFDAENDADQAVLEMRKAGLRPETVERMDVNKTFEAYDGNGAIVSETVLSGAVGGGFWGGLVGALAGLGMQAAGFDPLVTAAGQGVWAYLALAGIFAGQFVGSILGFAIGIGLSGEDSYQYELSLRRGKILLMAMVDTLRAPEAGQIMALVNLNARARAQKAATG